VKKKKLNISGYVCVCVSHKIYSKFQPLTWFNLEANNRSRAFDGQDGESG